MTRLLFVTLLLLCISTQAQNIKSDLPLAIEDAGMDQYLQNRELPTLTIQVSNMPDSIKKIDINYSLVTFGANFQVQKFTQSNPEGFTRIVLYQNLPYQQIFLTVGDYLYASIYVNSGLTVKLDANKISKDGVYMIGDGVTYSGIDGEFNKVMNKHVVFRQDVQNKLQDDLRSVCFAKI
jgi:hypothetical protein